MSWGYVGTPFHVCDVTPGTPTAAKISYSATTPFLVLSMASGSGGAAAFRYVKVNIASAVTAPVDVAIVMDTVNRYASGGAALTALCENINQAATSKMSYLMLKPTASAASAARVLYTGRIPANNGGDLFIQWEDGASDQPQITEVGSFLLYIFDSAATLAPSVYFNVGWYSKK
jgi:hypothetical protein